MPELPEVETIRRQLSKSLPLKIESYSQSVGFKKNILKTKSLKKDQLVGKKIIEIQRHGKMMIFIFDDGSNFLSHLLSHLGMTGTWLIGPAHKVQPKLNKHSHFIIHGTFKNEKIILAYDDPRRFGKMYFLDPKSSGEKISTMGKDLTDPTFDLEYLTTSLKKYPERLLKVTLLDQKFFAGSGNYIASEICARAGIRPDRKCGDLKKNDFQKILDGVHAVIKPAIELGGTTFQGGYRDSTGEKGQAQSQLVVFYQKICQLCQNNEVTKITLAGRGTYYCSKCQK